MSTTPPSPPGYRWRPTRLEDAAALAGLLAAVDAAEGLEEVLGPEGTRRELSYPGLDRERDTLLAAAPDGSIAAFAFLWLQPAERPARAILWMEAHPGHLHLEPFLMTWAEARAAPRLAPPLPPRRLRQHVEEHRARRRRVVEEAGYRHIRTFVEMWRPIAEPPDEAPPAPGVEIVPWAPPLVEGARLAANESFGLHWDSLPLEPEEWQQHVCADPFFRPDLSRLAVSEGKVVALCLASVDAEQNARRGVAELWVERVGTILSHQRRGLATAAVAAVLRAAADAGFTRAGLGVDQDSNSGFVATRRTLAYVKDLG
jgi:mycothiol synthase